MLSSIEFGKKQFSVLWADSPALGGSLRLKLNEFSCANAHIGVDTETTGLDVVEDRIRLVQLCCQDSIIIVDLFGWWGAGYRGADWSPPELAELKRLLESKIPKVLQNSPFDISMFSAIGVSLGGPIFDTMMAAKIINAGTGAPNDLGAIVKRELGRALPKEMQKARWGDTITGEMAEYAARDTAVLPLLVEPLRDKLAKSKVSSKVTLFDIFRLEMMVVRATASMRFNGFGFDVEAAKKVQVQLKQEADVLEHKFIAMLDQLLRKRHHKDPTKWLPRDSDGTLNLRKKNSGRGASKLLAGFNPNSPVQMVRALVDSGIELPVKDPRKGAKNKASDTSTPYTLDQNLLAFLRADYPIIDAYMTWKTQATLVSHIATLINAVSSDGRIHASYNQLGTNTGRYSASDPNLQQVPRSEFFRKLFIPRPGYVILGGDFSQIELRVAAELSEEPRMIQAYNDGRDLHMETACLLTGKTADQITKQERTNAKIANFGLLFGAGAATLRKQAMSQFGVLFTLGEAREIVKNFREAYPTLYEWQQTYGSLTTTSVYTRYGRRRILTGFDDKYTTRLNSPVQGTAGDIAKIAIAGLWPSILGAPEDEVFINSVVHDELVLEVRESRAEFWKVELKREMEAAGGTVLFKVPVLAEVNYGPSWGDAK